MPLRNRTPALAVVVSPPTATVSVTIANVTVASTATVVNSAVATVSATLPNVTLASTASAHFSALVVANVGNVTCASVAVVPAFADVNKTLPNVTCASAAATPAFGDLARTIDNVVALSAATIPNSSVASVTRTLTLSGSSTAAPQNGPTGAVSGVIPNLTVSSAGGVVNVGSAELPPLLTVTIPNGETTSDTATIPQILYVCGLDLPPAFTGTALSFSASIDGLNFFPLFYSGSSYTVPVTQSRYVSLDRIAMQPIKFVRVVSSTAEVDTRAISLLLRK
jgi:hypothetical protein